jgi:lia operon protein LiaG
MSLRPVSGFLTAAVAITLWHAPASAQTERRTVSGDRIAIYNLAGKLGVEAGSGSDVVVEITRRGRDANQLRFEEGTIRGQETVRVIYPADHIIYPGLERSDRTSLTVREDGTWGDDHSGRHSDGDRNRVEISASGRGLEAYADMRVLVPRGQRVAIYHAVGEARIVNVDADLAVDVAQSSITAEHIRGHLSLDTGSGSVSVTDAQGELDLDTGSGSVTISNVRGETLRIDAGSGSIRGSDIDVSDLKADVGSGGVHLERVRAGRVNVDAGSGGTELELLSSIENLKVEAGSGGVTVRLPESTNAEVDIETGSGGIDTDFAVQVTRFEQRHMVGRIGNGRGRIRIESGSGDVRLLKG